jgi:superfamily I DNA and/or RNA helicase
VCCDCSGQETRASEEEEDGNSSLMNKEEAGIVADVLKRLTSSLTPLAIGVISPYRAQVGNFHMACGQNKCTQHAWYA